MEVDLVPKQTSVGVGKEATVVSVHYSGEKLLSPVFSTENNFSIYALSRELLIQTFSRFHNCSPFYICILKWTKFFEKRI